MNKSNKYEKLWCHPLFKKKIKVAAAQKGMSVIDHTLNLALMDEDKPGKSIIELDNKTFSVFKNGKKKKKFDFQI